MPSVADKGRTFKVVIFISGNTSCLELPEEAFDDDDEDDDDSDKLATTEFSCDFKAGCICMGVVLGGATPNKACCLAMVAARSTMVRLR